MNLKLLEKFELYAFETNNNQERNVYLLLFKKQNRFNKIRNKLEIQEKS